MRKWKNSHFSSTVFLTPKILHMAIVQKYLFKKNTSVILLHRERLVYVNGRNFKERKLLHNDGSCPFYFSTKKMFLSSTKMNYVPFFFFRIWNNHRIAEEDLIKRSLPSGPSLLLKNTPSPHQYHWTVRWPSVQFSLVAQLCPTLRSHESQHARPPCPSPTPGGYSN